MKIRDDYKYALLAPTSMGLRITPADRQPVDISHVFQLQATSAESNVCTVAASLGLPVKVLTAFVSESPVAKLIKQDLRGRGIAYEGPEIPQGGAWGVRHQFNIADSGFGVRGPRVFNDRAGEVGRLLCADQFDLSHIFEQEGVAVLHLSGLIAALSERTACFCRALARQAKRSGTLISFDLNYRASFWKGREGELSEVFSEIAGLADILVGNEEDFQLSLGVQGPPAGGKGLAQKADAFRDMICLAQKRYPGVSVFATTLREVVSANEHLWGAIVLAEKQWIYVEPRKIPVLDRVGGGDAFVGGLLYGLLRGWKAEKAARFGWATGAMATTVLNDFVQPADEQQIWSIYEGNARIKR